MTEPDKRIEHVEVDLRDMQNVIADYINSGVPRYLVYHFLQRLDEILTSERKRFIDLMIAEMDKRR